MTLYDVQITPTAQASIKAEAQWWSDNHSSTQAKRWYEGFIGALGSLSEMPQRCQLARENRRMKFELRELHWGTGSKPTHRALYRIDEQKKQVVVLLVRRHSQGTVQPYDLE